ncbi:MAG: hypothetical protein WDM96_14100 [Lacunisphaera sp.]
MKVYRTKSAAGYVSYWIAWYVANQRKRETFSDKSEALTRAQEIAENLASGKRTVTNLGADDVDIYQAAQVRIKETGLTLLQVVDEFMRTWDKEFTKRRVHELVTEYQSLKRIDDDKSTTSKFYRADLKYRLARFLKEFGRRWIDDITSREVIAWINDQTKTDGDPWGNRTRQNQFNLLRTIWNYAQEVKALPQRPHALTKTHRHWKHQGASYSLLGLPEFYLLLDTLDQHKERTQFLPYVAIQAFAGVRVAEAKRLTWEDVIVENGKVTAININREKAKTKSRRAIHVNEALASFLDEFKVRREMSGPIARWAKIDERIHQLAKDHKLGWAHNQLRHSYATYALRLKKDTAAIAYEMGTSPAMLTAHYNELGVTTADAKNWFDIRHEIRPEIEDELSHIEHERAAGPSPNGPSPF